MRARKAFLTVAVVLSVLAVALVFVQCDADDQPPEDKYPYADIILTKDDSGRVLMTFKAYGPYKPSETHPSEWFTERLSKDMPLTLRDLSDAKTSMYIVVDGASISDLTVFNANDISLLNKGYNLTFDMHSGTIQSLSLMSFDSEVRPSLGKTYDMLHTVLRNVDINLYGGHIVSFEPSSDMFAVSSIDISVGEGMTVDRLLPTGINGKYSSVSVVLDGGTVGYMANVASKIGSVDYKLTRGSVNYLCLGTDLGHLSFNILEAMPTSYSTGDVTVRISKDTSVDNCILGAGIANIPSKLRDGEAVGDNIIRSVIIDAHSLTIRTDSMFFTNNRNSTYSFDHYTLSQSPHTQSIYDTYTSKGVTYRAFGEKGLWMSPSTVSVTPGMSLFVDADLSVPKGGLITVSEGGYLSASGMVALEGSIDVLGTMVNNGILECKQGSSLTGTIDGSGFVTDYFRLHNVADTLNVMTDMDAVAIELDGPATFNSIGATLSDERTSVSVSVHGSQPIYGDFFMLSMKHLDAPEGFFDSIRVDIIGVEDIMGICSVNVTVPTDSGKCTALCVFDPATAKYDVLATAEYMSSISADIGTSGQFFLYHYESDTPFIPTIHQMTLIDYVLIAIIIAVLATSAYLVFTMRRGRSS